MKRPMPKPSPAQLRMQKIVAEFQDYVRTYTKQVHYDTYSDQCFIDDMLYGIGIALDAKQFQYSQGFDNWKAKLREHLGSPPTQPGEPK